VHPTAFPAKTSCASCRSRRAARAAASGFRARAGDKRPIKQIPESDRWYFLEEWYPKYGNLVPRDVATRAIHKVVYELGLGIDGQPMVYLDLTHIDRETLNRKLEGILEIYEKFVGDDPRDVPMKIFPGMHYTMGGLWVDFNQMTNIPGIFAAGECEYQYHGANRLGANSLVSCIFGGFVAGPNAMPTPRACPRGRRWRPRAELARQAEINAKLLKNEGTENPFKLWRELGETMTEHATVIRYNKGLKAGRREDCRAARPLQEGEPERPQPVGQHQLRLRAPVEEHAGTFAHHYAWRLLRDESRGAHYKPDFPDRNDEKFLKTTKASFTGAGSKARASSTKKSTRNTSSRARAVTTLQSSRPGGKFRRLNGQETLGAPS
jgi:succinate dehydrogenase / fumarate reductase flavoprotein subunit